MKVLLSCHESLIIYDTVREVEDVVYQGGVGRHFGLTWDKDSIYVASKRNLMVFNGSYELVNVVEDVLDQNTHGMTWWKNKLIVCMTRKDCIKIMNVDGSEARYFHPARGWLETEPSDMDEDKERFHINTVVAVGDRVHVLLHNGGYGRKFGKVRPSEVLVLNLISGVVESRTPANACCGHNLYINDKMLGVISTADHSLVLGDKVIRDPEWAKEKRVFLRGMAGDENELVIGCTPFSTSRQMRKLNKPKVSVIRNGQVSHSPTLSFGEVNDIRRIDGPDYCHHNPFPFPA